MKKAYKNPSMKFVNVETQQMIAASGATTPTYGGSTTQTSGNLGRSEIVF